MIYKVYSRGTVIISRMISFFISPYYKLLNLSRTNYRITDIEIKTILVTEYHRIGDVLIISPVLKSLKSKFPKAHLILICNRGVGQLASHLNLADEIYTLNVPWTNWSWSIFWWWDIRSKAKSFSTKNIDLAFDFKGDIRNAWFLWLTRPKISFGYNTTGGNYFFTNPMEMNQNLHQLYRAFNLVSAVGCQRNETQEDKWVYNNDGAVVIHIGATDHRRSWPSDYWIKLIDFLKKDFKIAVVDTQDAQHIINEIKDSKVEIFKGDLIQFKFWLANQKCLIAPDSMAAHLAAYLKIPVVTLFGSQDPKLTSPIAENSLVITPEKICSHRREHWRLCSECMNSITPDKVYKGICNLMNKVNI